MRKTKLLVTLGTLAALTALYLFWPSSEAKVEYQTSPATHGNLFVSVSASGTLEPTNLVEVGSELSGIMESVNVDENDRVTKGQIIAQLDTAKLNDAITKSSAALVAAKANVMQAEATLKQSRASLARLKELQRLSDGRLPAKTDLDTAEAVLARAVADKASAEASVAQAEASLSSDKTNLEKATIRSPINGVVLTREIEPGQTVAASLQAPTLFQIAEDLAQMELQVNVDEADVGQVKEGQSATFTVDAYPNRKYPATITRLSYGSSTTDNVVTYQATLKVDNSDLSLRPGMTATAEINTTNRTNVLLVPNAALRYAPPVASKQPSRGIMSAIMPRFPSSPPRSKPVVNKEDASSKILWQLKNGVPESVSVTIGVSDGKMTEIVSGDLADGAALITGSSAKP